MIELVLFSGIAGIIGTGLGGLLGIIFGTKSSKTINSVLAFAGGAMIGMVFFSIIPESLRLSNPFTVVIGASVGILLLTIFNYLIDKKNQQQINTYNNKICSLTLKAQTLLVQNFKNNKNMIKSGITMFLAISLHNIPEGMAIGSVGMVEKSIGLTLAILLTLHNIPEGMAISTPLVSGGMKKTKALLITTLAGAVTIVGGLLGVALGGFNQILNASTLAFAGGAMLSVTFCDIIPAVCYGGNKSSMLYCLIGVGIIFLFICYL